MSGASPTRPPERSVELLAPAGSWDAFEAALDAGADAVFVSPRRWNLRRPWPDLGLADGQIEDAIAQAHRRGRRVYVTMTGVFTDGELDEVRELAAWLAAVGADAAIVEDLAVVEVVRSGGSPLPLHAGPMLGVRHAASARVLAALGFARVVTAPAVGLREAGDIGRAAGVGVEVAVHGEGCVAPAGQCSLSGLLFGLSAHRGRCLKPCRWEYALLGRQDGGPPEALAAGTLLSIKDLCLLQHVPEAAAAGLAALRLEARMLGPAELGLLVRSWRAALDAHAAGTAGAGPAPGSLEEIWQRRVRDLSPLRMLGGPAHREHFDLSGVREPRFVSVGCRETAMATDLATLGGAPPAGAAREDRARSVAVAVSVGDAESAQAAMAAGAARVYLAAEVSRRSGAPWSPAAALDVAARARDRGVRFGVRTAQGMTGPEWDETRRFLDHLRAADLDFVLVHDAGTLSLVREARPGAAIIADSGFGVLNGVAATAVHRLGAVQVTPMREAGLADLEALDRTTPGSLEVAVHGPVVGAVIDHCLIALHAGTRASEDFCHRPCASREFSLRDRCGQVRPLIPDHRCRNHLLLGHDLTLLPCLERVLLRSVASLRVDGQFYAADHVGRVVRALRRRLLAISGDGDERAWLAAWEEVLAASPRPVNLGPAARALADDQVSPMTWCG